MQQVFDFVVLTLLSLLTIRWIVQVAGLVPYGDKWYHKLIWGSYDEGITTRVFKELGISKDTVRYSLQSARFKTDYRGRTYLLDLIGMLSRHTYGFTEPVRHGNHETYYYVNTMAAGQLANEVEIMSNGIVGLMNKKNGGDAFGAPDFILTLKNGNVHLGNHVANKIVDSTLVLCKSANDKSRLADFNPAMPQDEVRNILLTNFEGSLGILERLRENPDRRLKGCFVDCNAARGNQARDVISRINNIFRHLDLNIEPVAEIFTLFRVMPASDYDADQQCINGNHCFHRYFDLNEDIKKMLCDLGGRRGGNPARRADRGLIKGILKKIVDMDLLIDGEITSDELG